MKTRDFENMPILAPIELDGNKTTIVLKPRNDESPKGRFATKSTGWMGSDKVMDSEGVKYQVNFQIIKIGSKPE